MFFFENSFFRTVRDVHLEIGLPIVVFHADADGTNPSSVSQFVKGPQLKNHLEGEGEGEGVRTATKTGFVLA